MKKKQKKQKKILATLYRGAKSLEKMKEGKSE
jgi:hypothetical protein